MRAQFAAIAVTAGVLLATGCGSSGPRVTAPVVSPPASSAGVSLKSPRVQQIALARASNRLFSIFPAGPGTRKCGIPEGGVHFKPLPGKCTTSIHSAPTHEPALIVTFTQRWNTCSPWDDCVAGRIVHHTWRVIEGEPIVTTTAHLHILATRQSGATAPQYYK